MTVEITRLATGTRVERAATGTRGTVTGYTSSGALVVRTDSGATSSGPAHHRTWRALTAAQLELEQMAEGKRRSFAVCPVCGFTDSRHSDGCAAQALAAEQAAAAALPAPDALRAAAQQLAAAALLLGDRAVVGCTCGSRQADAMQVVARYDLDGTGRLREPILWGVVRVLEHVMATPSLSRHQVSVAVAR